MNIGELAKGVAGTTGTSEAEAKAAIAAVFDQIAARPQRRRCFDRRLRQICRQGSS